MLQLRPHHLIDIVRNIGQDRPLVPHPYGHAQHIITQAILDGNEREFMLVVRADDLCKPCHHLTPEGICNDVLSQLEVTVWKQEYNDALDHRLFEFFGLQEGSIISLSDFLMLVESRFEAILPLCLHPKEDPASRREGLRKGLDRLMKMPECPVSGDALVREIIEKNLIPARQFIYGFADLRGLPGKEFEEYPFGISIGKKLDDSIVDPINRGPTLDYYYHYKEVNQELASISTRICSELERKGIRCLNIVPTLSLSGEEFRPYLKTLRYKVSHKMIATRAGLGWIGKTDLFVSQVFGPRLRLVSILVNKPVGIAGPTIDKSRCGRCNVCVEACPAQAATGKLWDIHTDRDEFFDARKCYEKCGELGLQLKADSRICGICVSVCPRGRQRSLPDGNAGYTRLI